MPVCTMSYQLPNQDLGIDITFCNTVSEQIRMHSHSPLEMVYILAGKGIYDVEGSSYEIGAGDLLIVPPDVVHAYRDRLNMSVVYITFDLERLRTKELFLQDSPVFRALFLPPTEISEDFRFRNRLSLSGEDREDCEKIIHKMVFEEKRKAPCWEAELHSLLTALLVRIVRACENHRYSGPENLVLLDSIIAYLDAHLRTAVSMPNVAKRFGLSQRNLERLFRNAVQCTPLAYLNGLRLKQAERLLVETRKDIGVIARDAGFPDSNYFTRVFRKKHQMVPRDYRKRHAKSP